MPISEWSENILITDLQDEPMFSDEIDSLIRQINQSEHAPDIVADFKAVSFINSSNIAQILNLRKSIADRGGTLTLCSINDRIWSVLVVTGLDKLFITETDTASALASIQLSEKPDYPKI